MLTHFFLEHTVYNGRSWDVDSRTHIPSTILHCHVISFVWEECYGDFQALGLTTEYPLPGPTVYNLEDEILFLDFLKAYSVSPIEFSAPRDLVNTSGLYHSFASLYNVFLVLFMFMYMSSLLV